MKEGGEDERHSLTQKRCFNPLSLPPLAFITSSGGSIKATNLVLSPFFTTPKKREKKLFGGKIQPRTIFRPQRYIEHGRWEWSWREGKEEFVG